MTFIMKLAAWTLTPALSIGLAVRIALGQNNVGRNIETYDLYQKTSDLAGEDEIMFKSCDLKAATSWSPDGRFCSISPSTRPTGYGCCRSPAVQRIAKPSG
jgi:hypothetical protein